MFPKVTYASGWQPVDDYETPAKAYRSGVGVELENGLKYTLFFVTPLRLNQELNYRLTNESVAFFAEANLIVVSDISREIIENTVKQLYDQGFFKEIDNSHFGGRVSD